MLDLPCLALLLCFPQDAPPEVAGADRLIATVPEDYSELQEYELPDGNTYSRPLPVAWSPDGSQVAYFAWRKGKLHAFLNEEATGESCDLANVPVFSADGQHVAWTMARQKRGGTEDWRVRVNDRQVDKVDWVDVPVVSADGGALAYWTRPGYEVDRDGFGKITDNVLVHALRSGSRYKTTESDEYSVVPFGNPPVLVRGGTHAVGAVYSDEGWQTIAVGGKREEVIEKGQTMIEQVAVHPDQPRIATVSSDYLAERPSGAPEGFRPLTIEIDGRAIDADVDSAALPAFSADGQHLAFAWVKRGTFGVGLDGEQLVARGADPITGVFVDEDGDRVAWIEHEGGELTGSMWLSRFSANMLRDEPGCVRWVRVGEDGVEGEPVEGPSASYVGEVSFEPGGDGFAFTGQRDDGWYVFSGQVQAGPFRAVGPLQWTAPGRVEFGTREGREFWWRGLARQ